MWRAIPTFFILMALLGGHVPFALGQTASLYLSPSSGTYTVGKNFSIAVKVNTGGVAMNAAQATIVFDNDKLSVMSISKAGSIFTLWTQDPVFSNGTGTIEFGGGVPNPGFSGSAGTILTITFRARVAGTATVSYSAGSVLANDGRGTNILASLGGGTYTLVPAVTTLPPPPPSQQPKTLPSGVPAAPVVVSSTHPQEDAWYSNNDPALSWTVSSGITRVSYTLDQRQVTDPTFSTKNIITEKTYTDIKDGTWYFHINFRNSRGWGPLTHRKVLVDTTPPESFTVRVDDRGDPTHPRPHLYLEATDATSGIDHYEMKIGVGEIFLIDPEQARPFEMPPQAPGKHSLVIRAVDRAGNSVTTLVDIFIQALNAPQIIEYPSRIASGDALIIKGTSEYIEGFVLLYIQRDQEDPLAPFEIPMTGKEKWIYVHSEYLDDGLYTIWAVAKDERGALSGPSNTISVSVAAPAFLTFGRIAIEFLTIFIVLFALLAFLFFGIWYLWYRFTQWRKRLLKETREAERALHTTFDLLHDNFRDQFKLLERARKSRRLTKEEEKLHRYIQDNLTVAEKYVRGEIKDIEKELKEFH